MTRMNWKTWLAVFLGVALFGGATAILLQAQGFRAAASVTGIVVAALASLWLLAGVIRWRYLPWVKWGGVLYFGSVLVVIVTGLRINPNAVFASAEANRGMPFLVASAKFGMTAIGYRGTALTIGGFWFMTVGFLVGLFLLRLVLQPGYAILGIARTLIDEAMRMKIALIFILMLLLLVPVFAIVGDPAERLSYRIQSFLSYALIFALMLPLALMTIFLSAKTICDEISKRYIYLTMTKPVSRAGYLAGKWLGVVLLNGLLLLVGGAGIYTITQAMRASPGLNMIDRVAVDNQVLVAREVVHAVPPPGTDLAAAVQAKIDKIGKEDSERINESMSVAKREETVKAIRTQVMVEWHVIPPLAQKTYRFTDVARAKRFGDFVQLRIKPKTTMMAPDEMVHMAMKINDYYWPQNPDGTPQQVSVKWNTFYVIDIPLALVKDDGNLDITIGNVFLADPRLTLNSPISIVPNEGMELRYQVATFEANLARSLLILWAFLGFLAMLSLAAGTFLGFPVACLLSILVMLVAMVSGFLAQSLDTWGAVIPSDAQMASGGYTWAVAFKDRLSNFELWEASKMVLRYFGKAIVWIAPEFGEYNPIPLVVDGQNVSYKMLGNALLKIGVIWTGSCALIGWLIFRARELARVTV